MELDGRFQIYTGDGKGKTTAALGLAARAACAGYHVYIGQFMKGGNSSELLLAEHFPGVITIEQYGPPHFVGRGKKPDKADIRMARAGFERIEKAMLSGEYDVIIADEINIALHMELLLPDDVRGLVDSRPKTVELVFTGRHAPDEFIEKADLVTEMREKKHYYSTEELEARHGIEF